MKPDLAEALNQARVLALGAGAILMDYFHSGAAVDWKAPGDPVTAADRAASRYIVSNLKELFPDHGILSEEEPDDLSRLEKSCVWMIDPMDGTSEFIERREEFAVMIGLVVDGTPQVGAVYQPTKDRLYYGAAGMGAFLEEQGRSTALHVSAESVAARLTLAESRSHRSARVEAIRLQMGIESSIASGSVGLKTGLICEGRAHLYIHAADRTHLWDACGPEAILREAGGRVTDIFNQSLLYNGREHRNANGLIASNSVIHDRAVQVTQAVVGKSK